MKLKDIKIGMKVRLLGKHRVYDEYDNIEDWYKTCNERKEVQQIKKQGYGIVTDIDENGDIWVSDCVDNASWWFSISDLAPYDEANDNIISNFINNEDTDELITYENKTPKEWLLTPMVTFITRNGFECVTLGTGVSYVIETGKVWDSELDKDYDNDLNYIRGDNGIFDIMSITYEGKVVWKRKEYMTLTDAIKTGKNIKHKDWDNFIYPADVMLTLSDKADELINLFTDEVWEVE